MLQVRGFGQEAKWNDLASSKQPPPSHPVGYGLVVVGLKADKRRTTIVCEF